jgi:hypothetical protein
MSRVSASSRHRWLGGALAVIGCLGFAGTAATEPRARTFSTPDEAFDYLHQVARSPRCVNCHGMYRGDGQRIPTVGDAMDPHPMNVTAGHNPDRLALGIKCTSCHGTENSPEPGGPPGVADGCPEWQMPVDQRMTLDRAMSKKNLCKRWRAATPVSLEHLKKCGEPIPNTVTEFFVHHLEHDRLIAWAFKPGDGREAAPGRLIDLVAAAKKWAPMLTDPTWCDTLKEEGKR